MRVYDLVYKDGAWGSEKFPAIDSPRTLILIFAAPHYLHEPQPIKELLTLYPQSKVMGCSTAGEITNACVLDGCIVVSIIQFDETEIKLVEAQVATTLSSYPAGKSIGDQLNQPGLRAVLVLSDGVKINGSELVKGLNESVPAGVLVTGGLAGDDDKFNATWCLYQNEMQADRVVAVGFYGDKLNISYGSKGGWDIFGPERLITSSKNNVLYELDDQPALELYKKYLDEKANDLPASGLMYPMAIRKNEADPHPLVRTILKTNEEENSVTFAGDMPQGYLAQLMRANFDRLVAGASSAGEEVLKNMPFPLSNEGDKLSIAISCVGRKLLLGGRIEEEVEVLIQAFPTHTHQVGFYSYGEIAPHEKGLSELHNQTMTLTFISEIK